MADRRPSFGRMTFTAFDEASTSSIYWYVTRPSSRLKTADICGTRERSSIPHSPSDLPSSLLAAPSTHPGSYQDQVLHHSSLRGRMGTCSFTKHSGFRCISFVVNLTLGSDQEAHPLSFFGQYPTSHHHRAGSIPSISSTQPSHLNGVTSSI